MQRESLRWWVGLALSAVTAVGSPAVADDAKPDGKAVPVASDATAAPLPETPADAPVAASTTTAPSQEDAPAVPADAPATTGQPSSVETSAPPVVEAPAPTSHAEAIEPSVVEAPAVTAPAAPTVVEAPVATTPAPVDAAPVEATPSVVPAVESATSLPALPPPETPKCEPEKKPWAGLGLKLNAGWGKLLLVDPLHDIKQTTSAQMLGVAWAPFNITGELGFSWLYDDKRWLANRADLRFFFVKGSRFSQYLALNADFGPTKKYRWVGAGVSFGFEFLVVRHVAVFAVATVEAMSFPAYAAPKVTPNPDWRREPKMFLYGAPSAVAGLQFRL